MSERSVFGTIEFCFSRTERKSSLLQGTVILNVSSALERRLIYKDQNNDTKCNKHTIHSLIKTYLNNTKHRIHH
jgi:hypothetical protein